jgi:hypothetical protein
MTNLEYANYIMRQYPDVSLDVKQKSRDSLKEYIYDDYPIDHDLLKKIIVSDMDNG